MKIAVIGCGNMGYAYAQSIAKHPSIRKENLYLIVRNEKRAQEITNDGIGTVRTSITEELSEMDFIILGTKPQSFVGLAEEIKPYIKPNQVAVSIMAGVSIALIESQLQIQKVIRTMPNTPCLLGQGATGYFANEAVEASEVTYMAELLAMNGLAVQVNTEDEIDAVTAVSGSGPAYYFLIMKSMVEAGTKLGLSEDVAEKLAKQTMLGSYHLMQAQSDKSFDELIANVKSKGGTTEAALNEMIAGNLDKTIVSALGKAKSRAKELSELIANS